MFQESHNLNTFRGSILIILLLIAFALISGCRSAAEPIPPSTNTPSQSTTPSSPSEASLPPESTPEIEGEDEPSATEELIVTPTLAPTATPGVISEIVAEIARTTGLYRRTFLGLTGEDWINLGISIIFTLLGIWIVPRIAIVLLNQAVKATHLDLDDNLVEVFSGHIKWFLSVLILQFSTIRLLFLSPESKQWLNQVYASIYIIIIALIVWKSIDLGMELFRQRSVSEHELQTRQPFLQLLDRIGKLLLIVTSATMILSNFGVNVTGLVAVLGIGGLALSLAAQDTLADTISGFIILLDQPFRVGDRIEISELDTWGDVVEIGTRTTRIRTRDNRMVIVPNSIIGKSQIVNYTYPDPRYRIQIEIGVEDGVNVGQVRTVITNAVRKVEGILPDKPVDVLFLDYGDASLILRVRWWIDSFIDTRRMFDKVNEEIYNALKESGIGMPPQTMDVNLKSRK